MADLSKAVFISYASQDGIAVKRISEALQAAGVEVWFDQDELTGGDAWDQKIRGQIKSCALFVPIISTNTNARREGYFRREWKLAVDRTHDMDDALPFLVPVVIDGTTDAGAFVPEKFREMQWTRLPGGATSAPFISRVQALLVRGTQVPESPIGLARPSPVARSLAARRRVPLWLWPVLALPVLGLIYLLLKPRRSPEDIARVITSPRTATQDALAKAVDQRPTESAKAAVQLAERAYALTQKLSFTREDLALAETLSRQATEREPDLARAWSVRAWVQAAYLMRNWDFSQKRRQDTQLAAERALNLHPDDADALNAIIQVLEKQGAYQEQEKLARRAIASDPKNVRSLLSLGRALVWLNRIDEAHAVLRQAVTLDPSNPLRHYELANSYAGFGFGRQPASEADVTAALTELTAAVGGPVPLGSALLAKAVLLASRRGDLPGMQAQFDELQKLPLTERSSDRAVYVLMQGALWQRRPAAVFAAAALTSQAYFNDTVIAVPKAWLTAQAYRLQGRENSAQQEWQSAEATLREQLRDQPGDPQTLHAQLAITLAWEGQEEEAAREIKPLEASWKEELDGRKAGLLARYYGARGDASNTLSYLQTAVDQNSFLTRTILRFDPWWDKLRGQPTFDTFAPTPSSYAAGASSDRNPAPKETKSTSIKPTDPQLRRAMEILDAPDTISADLGVAEDLVAGVLAAHPTDTEATIAMGRVHTYFLVRGFDRSEERFAHARQMAERGLVLAPDHPEALSNMGVYLYRRHTELPRAAKLMCRAIELQPDEPRYYRMLDNILSSIENVTDEEVIASSLKTAEHFPQDALVQYELARHYRDAGQLEPALQYLDRAVEYGPIANAMIGRAELKLAVKGDESELDRLDDSLPERYRSTDRAVYAQFIRALAKRQFSRGLEALQRLPEPWMIDFDFTGPTSLLTAELLLLQGKAEFAQVKFNEAQTEAARHRVDMTRNFSTAWLDPWILMRCGKIAEARTRNAVVFPELDRPFRIYLGTNWWFSPIPLNLLLGERDKALALIREAVNFQYGRQVIQQALKMDPRMEPWRNDPEIAELLLPTSGVTGAAKAVDRLGAQR